MVVVVAATEKRERAAMWGAAGFVLTLALSLPGVLQASGTASPPAARASQAVRGEVMIITDDFYVVKDAVGKGMVQVLVSQATELEKPIKPGDQIEARLSPEGYALWIRKLDQR